MQPFARLSSLILAVIATIARSGACTVVYSNIQVGQNFQVKVEDQGHPVKGLPMEIRDSRNGGIRVVSNTDQNGLARFRGIPLGSYHLGPNHDAVIQSGEEIEVRRGGPADVMVHLKWPNRAPIEVRSLQGTMHWPDYLPGQPQTRLSLDLLEGRSGRVLKSTETGDRGEFRFESVAPGLYFLSLRAGLIAVAVDPAAPTDRLDIDLGSTSCGLWYADRKQCLQPDLTIAQLSGQVLDVTGAVISGATIFLFDDAQTLVERLQSDSAGRFVSQEPLSGTYELVVTRTGFTPFRRTVHAESIGDSTGPSLTVKLGVGGSCSTGEIQ